MISVCIATFNASKYIREQLISILDQLSMHDEVIISDDLSTDDTINIIEGINDQRLIVIKGEKRLGVVKNFERALYEANGDFVFLSDQDDVWLSNKVAECIRQLESHILVVSDCIVVDENLNQLYNSFFLLRGSKKGLMHNLYKNSYMGCCMAFRKSLLTYALPMPKGLSMHDIWLGMLAEVKGSVCFLPKQLILYRRHAKNTSHLDSNLTVLNMIRNRIKLFFYLTIRLIKVSVVKKC